MRFRDFVYQFQRYSKTRVGKDDELRTWLSQAYYTVLGETTEVQENHARALAEIFGIGQRDGVRRVELSLLEQFSNAVIFKGSTTAVKY